MLYLDTRAGLDGYQSRDGFIPGIPGYLSRVGSMPGYKSNVGYLPGYQSRVGFIPG